MTHQEIAAQIECLGAETSALRKQIDVDHHARMGAIREQCGAIGHIFVLQMTYVFLGEKEQIRYACAVCGARRPEPE